MSKKNIGKCNHCDKEGNLNDEKICLSCRKNLKRNPNYIPRQKNIGKCNHCDKEGNLNDEKICLSCRKFLKRNPNHICRHKKPEKKCIQCGGKYHAKDLCKLCYSRSTIRNTPERKAKENARQELKKDEYNRNRGQKRNQGYQPRPDRSDFVCECGSTKHNTGGYCKKCAHRKLGYGQKYENSHVKERKIQRLKNPQGQKNAYENYSKKICKQLQMTSSQIYHKWVKTKEDCKRLDDYACQICGWEKFLHVHHIHPKAKYPELFFDMCNLITVCTECHNSIHRKKSQEKQNNSPKKEPELLSILQSLQ
jgi:5-methylcytosine-specific restriction endonuclease McrA